MTMTNQKKIKEQESILGMFPLFFFFIGLMLQLFISNTKTWWLSLLSMFIGMEIYVLFILWFYYELAQFKLKLRGNTKK